MKIFQNRKNVRLKLISMVISVFFLLTILLLSGGNTLFPLNKVNAATGGYIYEDLPGLGGIFSVGTADLDEDGDMDIIAGSSSVVLWFEGDGSGGFTRHVVHTGHSIWRFEIADLDKDGDLDIIGGYNDVVWYDNDGSEQFTRRVIKDSYSSFYMCDVKDIDEDGNNDIFVGAETNGNPHDMLWFKGDGQTPPTFEERYINQEEEWVTDGCATSVDNLNDSDIDIIAMNELSNRISWWSNDGSENFTRTIFETNFDGYGLQCIDLDEDGNTDVVGAGYNTDQVAWWKNDGYGGFTRYLVSALDGANNLVVIDIDGDGDLDVAAVSSAYGGDLMWYENNGSESFTPHTIEDSMNGGVKTISVAEFDGINAGQLDFISSGMSSGDWVRYGYSGLIENLGVDVGAFLTTNWSTSVATGGTEQNQDISIGLTKSGTRIAEIDVDFYTITDDLDWDDVSVDVNLVTHQSVVSNLTSAPHTASTHTLYIPKADNNNSVWICPDAQTLAQVYVYCPSGYELSLEDPNVTIENIESQDFWKVSGLTGTGGLSFVGTFDVRDTMTRLEVSQLSDHTIEFGTVNGLLDIGDTIEVQFDPGGLNWNLGSIAVGDIDLEDDGTDLSLAASADATHWGVSISTVTDTITFTHPTAADFEDIIAGSVLVVKVGTVADGGSNQITNPGTASSYEISMEITNGVGIESGETEIPIVDDDTVNITSYIDTELSFDIDTAISNTSCDASGGVSPCDSHGGVSDDVGYVVDIGEMTLSSVNRSGDSVLHADGLTGNINYIWFDLESNADSGTVVTVVSQHESMYMDASNEIPDVATGSEQQITSADGLYGMNHRSGFTNSTASGSLVVHVDCDCTSGDDYYCDVSDVGMPVEVFNSNSSPVDDGRVQWAIGVAPDSSDGTGTYTDQLTFIATSIF